MIPTPSMIKNTVWGHVRPCDVYQSGNAATEEERKAARKRVAEQTEMGLRNDANRLLRHAKDTEYARLMRRARQAEGNGPS